MKTIRNAAAHLSSTTSAKLDSLASRKMGSPQAGTSVYKLLLWVDPAPAVPATILSNYINLFDTAAEQIVNG